MTLYDEISANNRITILLFLLYSLFYGIVFFLLLWVIGISPSLPLFLIAALVILAFFYIIVFPRAPQAILSMTGAKEVKKSDDPYLFNIMEALAIGDGIPTPKVYLIESDALNAFATGPDPQHSVVAITTGLRGKLNRLELEGVMAHEMSHIKNYDIRSMLIASMFAMAIAIIANIGLRVMILESVGGTGRRNNRERGGGVLMLFALAGLVLAPIASVLMNFAISRNREYAADASGAMLTRYPEGLASALSKIQKEYNGGNNNIQGVNEATRPLFIFDPVNKGLTGLMSTHPPIEDRIARLRKM